MKLFTIAAAFCVVGAASALPAVDIRARAITGPINNYLCEATKFTAAYITQSITHAAKIKYNTDPWKELPKCDLSSSHARDIEFCQPKEFKNHPTATGVLHFPNCPQGPWYEFPLMADGHTLYNPPKAPGMANPARVIFQYQGGTSAHFCGAVTHSALTTAGQFISCHSAP